MLTKLIRSRCIILLPVVLLLLIASAFAQKADVTPRDIPDKHIAPIWPENLGFTFSKLGKIDVNKPFDVEVTVTARLFDVKDIEINPTVAGDSLKVMKGGKAWKGSLKKGKHKTFKFTVVAAKPGLNGQYGLSVTSKSLYNELRKYIKAQKTGPYAPLFAKKEIMERINTRTKKSMVYKTWAGGFADTGNGEKN